MSSEVSRRLSLVAAIFLALSLFSGCSTAPKAGADKADKYADASDNDPLEPLNRGIFGFNRYADQLVVRPAASIYRGVVPEYGRTHISNALDNLYSPVYLGNSILQLDGSNSMAILWRFLINSTFGVAGLFDAAGEIGLKARDADFGETLAFYGADTGAYLVLPLLGPSNVRDGVGRVGDMLLNPVSYIDQGDGASLAQGAAMGLDFRARNMELIDGLYRDSVDPYAMFRSAFAQRRADHIRRGKIARDKSAANAQVKSPEMCHKEKAK
ncbi:MAG: VacJ family lipoprotein [Alphaproteobacteria bacterium]|nr:VacJ family lipoprotein [Alphaproteobacteria bacterium]